MSKKQGQLSSKECNSNLARNWLRYTYFERFDLRCARVLIYCGASLLIYNLIIVQFFGPTEFQARGNMAYDMYNVTWRADLFVTLFLILVCPGRDLILPFVCCRTEFTAK